MKAKIIGFWVSLILMLVVVPYSIIEWFDKSIPYSNTLYVLSGSAIAIFVVNLFYLLRKQ